MMNLHGVTPAQLAILKSAVAQLCHGTSKYRSLMLVLQCSVALILFFLAIDIGLMFFTVNSYLEGTNMESGVIPVLMSMVGCALIAGFHIAVVRYISKSVLTVLRVVASTMVVLGLLALGVIYAEESAKMFSSDLASGLEMGSDGKLNVALAPWFLQLMMDSILPNLRALLPIGLMGMVLVSAICVDYLWEQIGRAQDSLVSIKDRLALKKCMELVVIANDKMLQSKRRYQELLDKQKELEESTAINIVRVGHRALSTMNARISRLELNVDDDAGADEDITRILSGGNVEALSLNALRDKRYDIEEALDLDSVRAALSQVA